MSAHPHLPPGSRCIRNLQRDFVEWHLGRPHYVLWALDVDCAAVRERVAAAQRCLNGLLLADYCRQPHITLSLCGFPSLKPCRADEFGATALDAQFDALHRARPQPFELGIGRLSSFASAPFLSVHDDAGHIDALRACLAGKDLNQPDGSYLPHVTVGLYAEDWCAHEVRVRMATFTTGRALRVRIERVRLFSYASADIGGPLTCLADFDFGRNALRVHGDSTIATCAGDTPDARMALQRFIEPG